MPETADKALLKEIAEQIDASTERCRAADSGEVYAAQVAAASQETIERSRSQIARLDEGRTARWRAKRRRTTG
jgi:hypothetical protein